MFGFFKEKLKNVLDKFKKEETQEKKEEEKTLVEEKKEIVKLEKEESKLEQKKEDLKEELEEIEKEVEENKASREEEKELKEELKEVEEKIEIIEEKKEEKKGFFGKIREKFSGNITEEEFEDFFQELEIMLIENNFPIKIIEDLRDGMENEIVGKPIKKDELHGKIKDLLKKQFSEMLIQPFDLVEKIKEKKEKPYVIVFFGINGAGKTTAIAKVTHLLKKSKLSVVLAAGDTFRAASIEQLEKHAAKLDVNVIKQKYGSDPAAVAFDAIAHAKARGIDVVLVDTAGRMHTKSDLMKEMGKIVRVSKPDLKVFVGESIVGNDVIEQATTFNDSVGIDASILTKADVDEKGGAMISLGSITKRPIIYLGTGQKYEDLEKFNPEKIIKSIF